MNIKNNCIVRGIYYFLRMTFSPPKRAFGEIGNNVIITPPCTWGNPSNVYIGNDVGIGPYAMVSAINAKLIIKGKCAIAERLTVHTGNHTRILGKFITDINETNKPKGYDKDVIIEEDVWIGCNVTLLSGVTIGRGSTIAAGAVVNKDIPPYCIAGGVPAKILKFYWSIEEILEHEKNLYREGDRYTRDSLEKFRNDK